jgi:hypothetical protein
MRMRAPAVVVIAALAFVAAAHAQTWHPTATWLAQAQCVHVHEAPWTANTGNGYFGGMQFAPQTWKRVSGQPQAAFAHPGDPTFPFSASPQEQLHRAWLVWNGDGRTWRSWGAVGALCSKVTASP